MAKPSRRYQPCAPSGHCFECGDTFTGTPFEVEAASADRCERTGHVVRITRSQLVIYSRVTEQEAEAC